jgi:uncharacterized protein with PIN domain
VAAEARVRSFSQDGRTRFFADAMLGRLARWLRILGFDVAFEAHIGDGELVRRAVAENRAILTRDRALPREWRVSGIYVISAEKPLDQLREVVRAFDLAAAVQLFSRCNRCNAPLDDIGADALQDRIPALVLAKHRKFRICPGCERVYWSGSHTDRMKRVARRVLADD